MSYDLAVWAAKKDVTAEEAGSIYRRLMEEQPCPEAQPDARLAAFARDLEALGLGDESFSAADNYVQLCLAFSAAEDLSAKVVALARKHGLACYDPQEEAVACQGSAAAPVDNRAFVAAVEAWAAAPSNGRLRRVMEELLKTQLLVAGKVPGGRLVTGAEVQVLTVSAGERRLLALFSDGDRLRSWAPQMDALPVGASQALSFAAAQGYDGVVVNPAGPPLELGRAHIEALLAGALPPEDQP